MSADSSSYSASAEIVTTGTEILLGEIVDTNAAWIAQQLREAGVNLYFKTTVGDNEARLRGVLEMAISRSNIVIVTGGLGPTADDITRLAIANATGRSLILHAEALETLKARFARFGTTMTDNNRQQAYIPEGAILIKNPVGTAPGFIVEVDDCSVIALPGVPREMKHLMTESVLPYVRTRTGDTGVIRRRVLRTIGIGESTIDSLISDLMAGANPSVGLAAHTAQVDIRVTARAATPAEAESLIDGMEAQVRARVGQHIYSNEAGKTIETVVAHLLHQHQQTVGIVETNTQGAVAQRLSGAADAHNPVEAAWQLGDDALPTPLADLLADAAASKETAARRTAELVRELSDATLGLAVIGDSGADLGIFGTSTGETWIAIAGPDETTVQRYGYAGDDEYTRVRLANGLLFALWQLLER